MPSPNKPQRPNKKTQQVATANGITLTAQVAPDGQSIFVAWQIVSDKDICYDWLKFHRNVGPDWMTYEVILPAIATNYQTGADYNGDPSVPAPIGSIADVGWYVDEVTGYLVNRPFASGEQVTYGMDAAFGVLADNDFVVGPRVTVTIP